MLLAAQGVGWLHVVEFTSSLGFNGGSGGLPFWGVWSWLWYQTEWEVALEALYGGRGSESVWRTESFPAPWWLVRLPWVVLAWRQGKAEGCWAVFAASLHWCWESQLSGAV